MFSELPRLRINRAILAFVVWIAQDFGAVFGHLIPVTIVTGEVKENAASVKVGHTALATTTVARLVSVKGELIHGGSMNSSHRKSMLFLFCNSLIIRHL